MTRHIDTEPKAINWKEDEQAWEQRREAREEFDRQRVSRSDIQEGDKIDVTIPDFLRDRDDVNHTDLFNAEVTEVHYGVQVRDRETGEYEYRDDHANEFVAECEGYIARVYCDRASWKLSLTPPSGAYTPDCNTAGLYTCEFQNVDFEPDDGDDETMSVDEMLAVIDECEVGSGEYLIIEHDGGEEDFVAHSEVEPVSGAFLWDTDPMGKQGDGYLWICEQTQELFIPGELTKSGDDAELQVTGVKTPDDGNNDETDDREIMTDGGVSAKKTGVRADETPDIGRANCGEGTKFNFDGMSGQQLHELVDALAKSLARDIASYPDGRQMTDGLRESYITRAQLHRQIGPRFDGHIYHWFESCDREV